MKPLFYACLLTLLVISCTKDFGDPDEVPESNSPTLSTTNTLLPADSLHPTGVLPDDPGMIDKIGYYVPANRSAVLPASVDLSGKMPPVGHQRGQSSCVGWAVGYYCKTYQERVEEGWPSNNIFSPSYIYNQINGGRDEGSSIGDACDLLGAQGCDFLDNFQYSSSDYLRQPDAGSKRNAGHYRSAGWFYLAKDVANLKAILASSQVFIISLPVYPDFDRLGAGNEIYDDWSGTSRGGHALCVVGYDDTKKAFKFVNSWGPGWGINGYGWIAYSVISKIRGAYLLLDRKNTYETRYLLGDFDGNKIQDVLTTNGYGFYVSWNGKGGLKKIQSSTALTSSLKIGDFNGDGKSDVFYMSGSEWKISYSGSGNWTTVKSSTIRAENVAIGDFNGDGKADIFYPSGFDWRVSYSGSGGWTQINASFVTLGSLRLGDFNGDGKADVLHATGSEWKVWYSGTGRWTFLREANTPAGFMKIGDMNGDGKSDVFIPTGLVWKVSYSGSSSLYSLKTSSVTIDRLELGKFDSDAKWDVFCPTAASWKVSYSGTSPLHDL